jgi:CheY-like chemotaxis protein
MPTNGHTLPCRVLIVDDCPDAAGSLAILLQLWGHEVYVTHDGPSALEATHALQPGAVLLDIGMPGMDGWEVARRIRQQDGAQNILLVALSGYGQEQDRQHSREVGCDFHLVKPFDPNELMRLLQPPTKSNGMEPEGLVRLLTSLGVAAEVVEAIDHPSRQFQRGWDLTLWIYEAVPWGVQFLQCNERGGRKAAVVALALPEGRRPEYAKQYANSPWPTTLLFFG